MLMLLIGCVDNGEKKQTGNTGCDTKKNTSKISKGVSQTKKIFFDNGVLKAELNYLSGKLEGVSKEYYRNGKLRSERFYQNGQAVTETKRKYYVNDALLTETNYKSEKLHGVCRTYFENGQLNDETHFEDGHRHGQQIMYYMDGQLWLKFNYLNDKKMGFVNLIIKAAS